MDLYRYIPFESFIDLVQSKELTFVSPITSWEDTYEGILYRAMKTSQGKSKIQNIVKKQGLEVFCDILSDDYAIYMLKCQCWSKQRDSVAMWSIYSNNNNSIMIKTNESKLKKLKYDSQNLSTFHVKYIKDISLEDEILQATVDNSLDISMVFKTKRVAFQHEEEVRVFVGGVLDLYDSKTYSEPIRVKIPSKIENFIEEVLVHPKAADWYVKIIEKFCKDRGINFLGKSKLYEFEI